MLKIYGVYRSRATRPLWLAEEAGIAFEHVPVIQAYRIANAGAPDAQINTRSPEFLAVNPMGEIPSLQDGDFILHESLAITLYMARKYGGALGPSTIEEEALMVQWSLFGATAVEPSALRIMQTKADSEDGREKIEAAAKALEKPFSALEKQLAANGYLVGGRFTVADINVAEVVRYAQGYPALFESRPTLKNWIETCQARPGFKAMWEKRMAEPA